MLCVLSKFRTLSISYFRSCDFCGCRVDDPLTSGAKFGSHVYDCHGDTCLQHRTLVSFSNYCDHMEITDGVSSVSSFVLKCVYLAISHAEFESNWNSKLGGH